MIEYDLVSSINNKNKYIDMERYVFFYLPMFPK